MQPFAIVTLVLILARAIAELWLSRLNQRHVCAHANELPAAFHGIIDEATYRRSVDYTLAKSRFANIAGVFDVVVLIVLLFSGVLPWAFGRFTASFGRSIWAMAGFLFFIGTALSMLALPFAWYAQFKLEEIFGFNAATIKTWVLDRVKGFLLALLLGYPLLALVLKIIEWTGANWWLWAAGTVVAFQLLLMLIAPAIIMPLFNKFRPLPEGALRQRLFALAQRAGFPTRSIEVMDGSKRSRHSNAFFTGFKRFRKIVLFDTLIAQLTGPELEAVLAHEIGHYKKGHIPKMLAWSAATMLGGFFLISILLGQEWFFAPFGFQAGKIVPAILLFTLLGGLVSFWFSPLAHWWSRKYEYEADVYAAETMKEIFSLTGALRKLNE